MIIKMMLELEEEDNVEDVEMTTEEEVNEVAVVIEVGEEETKPTEVVEEETKPTDVMEEETKPIEVVEEADLLNAVAVEEVLLIEAVAEVGNQMYLLLLILSTETSLLR